MKKELAAIFVLVLVFATSLINIHFLNRLTSDIASLVEQADTFIREENWERAGDRAQKAFDRWENSDSYTHIVLRHSEIESVSVALGDLIKEIYAENAGAARGAARSAAERVRSVSSVERLRLNNIF